MVTKAVILAAGFGTRMKEYTKAIPKPMLPLNHRPLIEYTIRQLASYGIKEIAMNLHYHADVISNYFEDGKKFGVKITYVYEDFPTGTAGGVKKLESFCQGADNILVIYGDIISDLNYNQLIESHFKYGGIATICVHQRKKSNSIIEFDSKMCITNFIERPDEATLKKYATLNGTWVNSAIYCFKPEILHLIKNDILQDFPKDIFPQLLQNRELYAFELNAHRYAIDSEEKYLEANSNIAKFQFNFDL